MMCALFLKPKRAAARARLRASASAPSARCAALYARSLGWVLRHPLLTAARHARYHRPQRLSLRRSCPRASSPSRTPGRIVGSIQAEQDISFPAMRAKMVEFANIVADRPRGRQRRRLHGRRPAITTNSGRVFISLKPLGERKVSADQVIDRLRGKLAHVPGATLFLQAVQDVRIGGRQSNAQYQYTLQSTTSTT